MNVKTFDAAPNDTLGVSLRDSLRERIAPRWPNADAFYAARDDRTVRVAGLERLAAYAARAVEIHVDPQWAHDVTVQRIALVAANLTARWARRLRVVLPGAAGEARLAPPLRRADLDTLRERIEWETAMADPFGDTTPTADALRLYVGPWRGLAIRADDYQVHAEYWSALGRRGEDVARTDEPAAARRNGIARRDEEATAAAAGLAGALGAADLLKRAIGHDRSCWMPTFAWDTWSSEMATGERAWDRIVRRPAQDRIDQVDMLIAGVGAIGSALLYLIDLVDVDARAKLMLFDRDRVDVTNLNRSPLFTVLDAYEETLKTQAGMRWLNGREGSDGLRTRAGGERLPRIEMRDGLWREHMSELSAIPFDVWVSLTNEDGAWADVPFELPPVVLQGTTTSGWGFGAGRHVPRAEDCTLCRMPRPESVFRGPCAEGEVVPAVAETDLEPVRASLPFLSTASAALILAELMQLQCEGRLVLDLPNDIAADLGAGLPAVVALRRGPTDGCGGCAAARTRAWETLGGKGRFGKLSLRE
jgi:ThiF family protein